MTPKLRPSTFLKAAERIERGDSRWTCFAIGLHFENPAQRFWRKMHNENGGISGPWFGDIYNPANQILRAQLLREAAFNLKMWGYEG